MNFGYYLGTTDVNSTHLSYTMSSNPNLETLDVTASHTMSNNDKVL